MDDATFLQHLMEVTTEFEDLVEDLEPGTVRQSLQDLVDRYDALIDCLTEGRATLARVKVPRLSAAAQEKVLAAIAQLEEDGIAVTNANVYKLVGGSHGKLEAFLKEWRRTPRKRETNGTQATTPPPQPAPPPAPAPAPEPVDELERLYSLRGLALKRQAAHLAEKERLTVQPFWEYAHDVPGHNRQVNAADKGAEHEGRHAAQYTYEINRWRVSGRA